jgi:hypothetical protein
MRNYREGGSSDVRVGRLGRSACFGGDSVWFNDRQWGTIQVLFQMGWEYVRTRTIRGKENGASLIEFALLMPLLLLLVLGIIEFGWLFSQNNDVKHGAREGARAAAVDLGGNSVLLERTCDSMDLASGIVTVEFNPGDGDIGDAGWVSVVAIPRSLSGLGLIENFLPATLSSRIEFRLEQEPSWSVFGPTPC